MSGMRAPPRVGVLGLLITAVCAVSLTDFGYRWSHILGTFWDVSVYERAVADYGRGANPYRTDALFPFVYHPLVLRALALLNGLVPLRVLFPALTLAALAWLSCELLQATRRNPSPDREEIGPARFLIAIGVGGAFGGIGAPALLSGNLAPSMDFTLMAALIRGRYAAGAFCRYLPYGLILLFALVKPYFLLILAAPVMLYERRMTALVCAAIVAALFGATWFSLEVYWPGEYAQFLANLRWHILGRGDLGYTLFHVFAALTHNALLALVLHTVVCVLLVALVQQFFKQRYPGRKAPFVPLFLVIYLVLTLANPRMKDYDLFPAMVGFFAVLGALSRRSASLTLAALLPTVFPLTSSLVPELAANHPMLFDPFGTWQLVGLAVLGIALLAAVLQEDRRVSPVEGVRL